MYYIEKRKLNGTLLSRSTEADRQDVTALDHICELVNRNSTEKRRNPYRLNTAWISEGKVNPPTKWTALIETINTSCPKDESRECSLQGDQCLIVECFESPDERTGDCISEIFVVVQQDNSVPQTLGEDCNWRGEIDRLAWQAFR